MSDYADYQSLSSSYDLTRDAVGLEIVLGCLAASGRSVAEQRVLDAGCGTGNYAQALLRHVRRVDGVDANEAMLEAARVKLGDALKAGRAGLHCASLESIPLDDQSVDGVVVNQVIHHLAPDEGGEWSVLNRVMGEFSRVLKPGGVLAVNICSHSQIREGFWYTDLISRAVEEMCGRHPSLDQLEAAMRNVQFEPRQRFVPVDALMQGRHYFDALGPTRSEWRAGDSVWSLLSRQELESVETRLREMHAAGTLEAYLRECDRRRRDIGQLTFVYAVRA